MPRNNFLVLGFVMLLTATGTSSAADGDAIPRLFLYEHSETCAEEPHLLMAQATDPTGPSGEVQERAVPRMAPGLSPEAAPLTKLKGGAVQGNRLQADAGYVLEPLPGNRVALKPVGGGPTIEANCMCRTKGGCAFEVVGPSAFCKKSTTNGCTSNCVLTVGGKLSGGQMSIQ